MTRPLVPRIALLVALAAARPASADLVGPPLTPDAPRLTRRFELPRGGEVVVALTAEAAGHDFRDPARPAAVLRLGVDGKLKSDLALHHGARAFTYRRMLGHLDAGAHTLQVALHGAVGNHAGTRVKVTDFRLEVTAPGDPGYDLLAHAPILVGREDALNDLPLLLMAMDHGGGRRYHMIFANEDGGTPKPELMSRWGRLADIEWVWGQTAAGGAQYQAADHKTEAFEGPYLGGHPVLRVATENNNFAPASRDLRVGPGRLIHAIPPLPEVLEEGASRERVMDAHPWTYRVVEHERVREGGEDPGDPATLAPSDMRNYLVVEARLALDQILPLPKKIFGIPSGHPMGFLRRLDGAHVSFEVTLADGRVFSSDHFEDAKIYGIYRDGWNRTTVELPPGTGPAEVVKAEAVWKGRGIWRTPTMLAARGFMLGADYAPGPDLFAWEGRAKGGRHDLGLTGAATAPPPLPADPPPPAADGALFGLAPTD